MGKTQRLNVNAVFGELDPDHLDPDHLVGVGHLDSDQHVGVGNDDEKQGSGAGHDGGAERHGHDERRATAAASIDIPAPEIPPPDACIDRTELAQGVALPIASRIDVRVAPGSAVADRSERAIVEGWIRLRDGTPPSVLSLPLFADAFPPSLFAKLGSVGWVPTIELTVHVRRRPVDGWVQARFECDDLAGGRMIESGTLWDRTGRVVARSRQLGLLLTS